MQPHAMILEANYAKGDLDEIIDCHKFDMEKITVSAGWIEEIEKETERYGKHVVIRDGGIILVNYLAFVDFLTNRKRLMEPNLRKHVPEYDPRAIEQELGRKPEVEAI